jgi:hypothetical protein
MCSCWKFCYWEEKTKQRVEEKDEHRRFFFDYDTDETFNDGRHITKKKTTIKENGLMKNKKKQICESKTKATIIKCLQEKPSLVF